MDKIKLLFSEITTDFSIGPILASFFDFSDGETKRLTRRLKQQQREIEEQQLMLEECNNRLDAIIGEFIEVSKEKDHVEKDKQKRLMHDESSLEDSQKNTRSTDRFDPAVINVALSDLLEFSFFKTTIDTEAVDLKSQLVKQVATLMESNVTKTSCSK